MRFLVIQDMETAYSRAMLNSLVRRSLIPEMVIEEDSANAEQHRELWAQRLRSVELGPSIAAQVERHKVKYAKVSNLNLSECEEVIKRERPDLLVLGGTRRIIKKNIFAIAPWGTLCSHPGLLPYMRGASSVAWSIQYDIQIGCSCIIIDEGIDTGRVVKTRTVPVYRKDSYEQIVERNIFYCTELMAEVVEMFAKADGPISGVPQDLSIGKAYPTMPPELLEKVKIKLANGNYGWFES
jgi:methionyl-tRNA formyltransferase